MIGNAVTSKSCSGTCLIFSRARQPKVSDAASAPVGAAAAGRAAAQRLVGASTGRRFGVGRGHASAPPSRGSRPDGGVVGQGQERPRRGWAGRGRSRRRRCRRRPARDAAAERASRSVAAPADAGGQRRPGRRRAAPARRARSARASARPPAAGRDRGAAAWTVPAPTTPSARRGCPRRSPGRGRSPRSGRRAGRPRRGTAWSAARSCRAPTSARTMSHTWLRLRGSRPVVGSSRKSRSGVMTMLAAMSMRRRMPPEYFLTWRSRRLGRGRTRRAVAGPAARPAPASRPSSRPSRTRFSRPVRSSSTEANWPVRLTRRTDLVGLA